MGLPYLAMANEKFSKIAATQRPWRGFVCVPRERFVPAMELPGAELHRSLWRGGEAAVSDLRHAQIRRSLASLTAPRQDAAQRMAA